MVEDRSLDEFAVSESPVSESAEGDGATSEERTAPDEERTKATDESAPTTTNADPTAAEPEPPLDDADPVTPTSTWTADGADCERCGERADRRWTDDGSLVCVDCKTW